MINQIISTEDFNKKLLEALCNDEEESSDLCLITGEVIRDDHIKLVCGHKFNYHPIFNELSNQKVYSKLETHRLKKFQIKCPYCRTIQNGVIPFNKGFPMLKEEGVNWPPKRIAKNEKCTAILRSGKRKGEECGRQCFSTLCPIHQNSKNKSIPAIVIRCIAILGSGKRKGEVCNCLCKSAESKAVKLCKRHYKNNNIAIC